MIKEAIFQKAKGTGWIHLREFMGCSEDEIHKLQILVEQKLPLTFIKYLQVTGKHFSEVNRSTGGDYDEIYKLALKPAFKETLLSDFFAGEDEDFMELAKVNIPSDMFIIAEHQGYGIDFFRLSEGENPPVYMWLSDETQYSKTDERFSDYVLRKLHSYIKTFSEVLNGYARSSGVAVEIIHALYYSIKEITFQIIDQWDSLMRKYPAYQDGILSERQDYEKFSLSFLSLLDNNRFFFPKHSSFDFEGQFPGVSGIDEVKLKMKQLEDSISKFRLICYKV